jgi:DNA-binding MarR family transcriptional regulator
MTMGEVTLVGEVGLPVRTTYLVKQLELAIRQNIDRSIRRFGLTAPQYTALSVLARYPGLSSAQLARRSFVTPQAANEMVAALERKGLIERHAGSRNHRVLEMFLTDVGRETLDVCNDGVFELERRMLAGMTLDEAGRFRTLLESCLVAVTDETSAHRVRARNAS